MKKDFDRGIIYSVALLHRSYHENAAETLWQESGFTKDNLAGCEKYDVDEVKKMLKAQEAT